MMAINIFKPTLIDMEVDSDNNILIVGGFTTLLLLTETIRQKLKHKSLFV